MQHLREHRCETEGGVLVGAQPGPPAHRRPAEAGPLDRCSPPTRTTGPGCTTSSRTCSSPHVKLRSTNAPQGGHPLG
ncbi:hypothetical protein [Streptomyces sp. NPDC002587]